MSVRRLLVLAVALCPWGCNALFGIEKATETSEGEHAGPSGQAGTGEPLGPAEQAGSAGTTGAGGSSLPPVGGDLPGKGGEGGEAPSAPCNIDEVPTEGVFVDARPERGDDAHAGSQYSPLRTIGRALTVAAEQGQPAIFLAPGTYAESLDVRTTADPSPNVILLPEGASFRLEGGWQFDGARWQRDCAPTAREKTAIVSTTLTGLALRGHFGNVALRTLSIVAGALPSTPIDSSGASSYGIFASGDGLRLRLEDVIVEASKGGRGGDASPGLAGVGTVACNVYYSCSSGAPGADASAGTAAGAGEFSPLGFVPRDGGEGQLGGTAFPGTLSPGNLETCGQCNGDCSPDLFTVQAQGACGCPGTSGGGGRQGRGGGASVALFADGQNVEVMLAYTTLRSRDGGDGSSGGEGGVGADGSAGTSFPGRSCCLSCYTAGGGSLHARGDASSRAGKQQDESSAINVCLCNQPVTLPARPAGGPGGRGGHGGKGGGGSGGPSFALVHAKTVTFQLEQSAIVFGRAGVGANGAANGEAGSDKLLASP